MAAEAPARRLRDKTPVEDDKKVVAKSSKKDKKEKKSKKAAPAVSKNTEEALAALPVPEKQKDKKDKKNKQDKAENTASEKPAGDKPEKKRKQQADAVATVAALPAPPPPTPEPVDEEDESDSADASHSEESKESSSQPPSEEEQSEDSSSQQDVEAEVPQGGAAATPPPPATPATPKAPPSAPATPKSSAEGQPHEFVAATQTTAQQAKEVMNSVTHHKEWNTFNRQCNNRKVFPVQLANHLLKNKQDLSQTWMESGKDWDRVVLTVNRTNKQRNISESGWKAEQGKTIKENWKGDQQKLKQLLKSRVDSGLFYDDPDFPDDEDERWYYMRKGAELTHKNETGTSVNLKAEADVPDAGALKILIDDEEGVMRAGQLPEMQASGNGTKALFEAYDSVMAAPKKPRKKDEQPAQPAAPKTVPELAAERMHDVLNESTQARALSLKLQEVEYTGELSRHLMDHANVLEKHFQSLQKAVKTKTDDSWYAKLYSILDERHFWFEKAENAANSILKGLKQSKKNKDKAPKRKAKGPKAKKGSAEK